jgi:DNA-binding MarR family transcriptional regulator
LSRQDPLKTSTAMTSSGELEGKDLLLHLDLRLRLDEIADVDAERLRLRARRPPTRKELCHLAYAIYTGRRLRDRIVDDELFGEPAWDILLALYCLPPRGQMLTVTGLSYAANINPVTGLRWQKMLIEHGLIERGPEGVDRRKMLVRLTNAGRELMRRLLTRLYDCEPRFWPQSVSPSKITESADGE